MILTIMHAKMHEASNVKEQCHHDGGKWKPTCRAPAAANQRGSQISQVFFLFFFFFLLEKPLLFCLKGREFIT